MANKLLVIILLICTSSTAFARWSRVLPVEPSSSKNKYEYIHETSNGSMKITLFKNSDKYKAEIIIPNDSNKAVPSPMITLKDADNVIQEFVAKDVLIDECLRNIYRASQLLGVSPQKYIPQSYVIKSTSGSNNGYTVTQSSMDDFRKGMQDFGSGLAKLKWSNVLRYNEELLDKLETNYYRKENIPPNSTLKRFMIFSANSYNRPLKLIIHYGATEKIALFGVKTKQKRR